MALFLWVWFCSDLRCCSVGRTDGEKTQALVFLVCLRLSRVGRFAEDFLNARRAGRRAKEFKINIVNVCSDQHCIRRLRASLIFLRPESRPQKMMIEGEKNFVPEPSNIRLSFTSRGEEKIEQATVVPVQLTRNSIARCWEREAGETYPSFPLRWVSGGKHSKHLNQSARGVAKGGEGGLLETV